MKSTGLLFLGIPWILGSLVWFLINKNTAMGLIWLCGGIIEVSIALIRCNREKSRKSAGRLSRKGSIMLQPKHMCPGSVFL